MTLTVKRQEGEIEIHADYVVAADGTRSTVRDAFAIARAERRRAHGLVPQPDAGPAAPVWQPRLAKQDHRIASFALRWLPTAGRPALAVLALQAAAVMLLAVAPLWALGGL